MNLPGDRDAVKSSRLPRLEELTVPSTGPDLKLQSSVSTLCLAAGMLLGGIIFARLGALSGSDRLTVILAAIGMVSGSISGGYLGTRWHRTWSDHPVSTETSQDKNRNRQ
jgi:uncharacterized protein YcfJ